MNTSRHFSSSYVRIFYVYVAQKERQPTAAPHLAYCIIAQPTISVKSLPILFRAETRKIFPLQITLHFLFYICIYKPFIRLLIKICKNICKNLVYAAYFIRIFSYFCLFHFSPSTHTYPLHFTLNAYTVCPFIKNTP